RFLGYNDVADKLPGEMPKRADIGDAMRLGRHVREFMIARGFSEILTYSFLPENFTQTLRLTDERSRPLLIANPISREQMAMRTTLLPGLLSALKTSVNSGWREPVRVFEQGRVFINDTEPEHLAALLFNGTDNRSPNNDRSEGFYDLKSDVDALIRSRGVEAAFRAGSEPFMHSGQCADVLIGGRKVGYLGRVKPVVEQDLGVSGVYVFELDLGSLIAEVKPVFKAVSEFPASLRDISLLVPVSVSNDDVVRDIHECVSGLEAEVRLFDVYEGQGIPEGYRSLAYTLSYRAGRTLRDEEVEGVHVGLREGLAQRGYILR
ncbi:MAG: phenylalanine--tRNA ligase subunit beta, partial [Synergistaceae bacterium]|nr:phenylalanine--tRNA ligase subunit beta [Synergistaceae bacterium]